MKHTEASPLAGKLLRIKQGATHPQISQFAGLEIRIEDWWDRITGKSWKSGNGNPACLIYAMRSADNALPMDDEVLYGKIMGFGHLVHVSEIEEVQ